MTCLRAALYLRGDGGCGRDFFGDGRLKTVDLMNERATGSTGLFKVLYLRKCVLETRDREESQNIMYKHRSWLDLQNGCV